MLIPDGLIPGSYTPFAPNNKLNEKLLAEELERVVPGSGGLHGPAGHSEFASLTFDEWKVWTDVMVDVCRRAKIPAWSFLGTESFEKTLPYAEYALKAGAAGIWLMAPYFNIYSQEAAYCYHRDFARAFCDTPIVFYPSHQTGNHYTTATIARIAELPNMIGMKLAPDCTFDEMKIMLLNTQDSPKYRWVAGSLNVLYPLMTHMDFKATCSVLSNFVHDWSLKFWNAYLAHDWATVAHWEKKMDRLFRVLSATTDRHAGARAGHKAALKLLGRDVGPPRRPGLPADEEHIARIRKVFVEEGLL